MKILWLDANIDLADEDDSEYQRCSSWAFVGSENTHLDGPELLDLLPEKPIAKEPQTATNCLWVALPGVFNGTLIQRHPVTGP